MRKASTVLFNVGFTLTVFTLFFFVVSTVIAFIISGSGYVNTLIYQIESGALNVNDIPGTVTEQVAYIQNLFIKTAIIFLVASIVTFAGIVIAIFAKRLNTKKFHIISIIVNALSINIPFILASSFALKANQEDIESIEVSY